MIHLEDFPNEIFLEIFKYFTLSDLFDSFVDLNYRINALLQSINERSLILNKPEDVLHPRVFFFKRNIQHLQIRHPSKVDFQCFPNLRSLTSLFPRDQQLIGLRPKKMPHLTHLTIGFLGIWDCEIMLKLCQRIFSNKFHNLRYCSLWPPAFNDTCTTKTTPTINHIRLQEGTLDDLRVILNVCPNLKRLQVNSNSIEVNTNWYFLRQILVSMFAKVPVQFIHHENIERLEVSFVRYDGMWFEKLDWLFASLFNVKHLVISLCLIQADLERKSVV